MNPLKTLVFTLFVLLLSTASFAEDDENLTTQLPVLTSDTAVKVAQNTINACRKKGAQVAATVVDRFGIVQAQIRDTVAPPITVSISERKARTAANFNSITSQLGDMRDGPLNNIENLLVSPGGAPISAGGLLYGAVGVSGSTGEIDEECAIAGAMSIQDDLEMQ